MLQGIFGTYSLIWIKLQQLIYKINGFWCDALPFLIVRTILTFLHIFYYLFIVGSVERRIATQQYVEYYAYTPQVTFFIIRIIEDLWRYVVWCAVLLLHLLTRVKDARGSEVNYCYFGIILVSVQQQVLRFEVSMNYVTLMAIIYR